MPRVIVSITGLFLVLVSVGDCHNCTRQSPYYVHTPGQAHNATQLRTIGSLGTCEYSKIVQRKRKSYYGGESGR